MPRSLGIALETFAAEIVAPHEELAEVVLLPVIGILVRCLYDLVHIPARPYDLRSFPVGDEGASALEICGLVDADDKVVAAGFCSFNYVQMTYVEEIKGP